MSRTSIAYLIDKIENQLFTHMFDPERLVPLSDSISLVVHGRGYYLEYTESQKRLELEEVIEIIGYANLESTLGEVLYKEIRGKSQ